MRALAAALLLAVAAAPAGAGCDDTGERSAVAAFLSALAGGDGEALLATLPRETPLSLTSTIETPMLTDVVAPDQLRADLTEGTGYHQLLIDGGPDDDLADVLDPFTEVPWHETAPGEFTPRSGDGGIFLRLACEAGRVVIAEIAWPAA